MKLIVSGGLAAVVAASLTVASAQGQAPSQASPGAPQTPSTSPATPTTSQPSTAAQSRAGAQQITVTGCIQREADYRRSTAAGRGGAAGTGLGVGNEFILANASMANRPAGATPDATAPAPTGTTGSAASAYELTGPNESKAEALVGKRVEITGTLKAAATAGGPTADVPGSRDLKLQELELSTIRETTGTCSPAAQE
jgi:hypothetical protein